MSSSSLAAAPVRPQPVVAPLSGARCGEHLEQVLALARELVKIEVVVVSVVYRLVRCGKREKHVFCSR